MKNIAAAFVLLALLTAPVVHAVDDGESDVVARLERLCSDTENASELTAVQLKSAIAELETLDAEVRKSDYPKKKLYLFRIAKCRDFLRFSLDVKK